MAWRRGRLGHAYFFVGPAGIGKRLFARELAFALLCERATNELAACGECAACHLTAAGTHPDFLTAWKPDGATELPIETVRELCAALALKPARGGRKIAILDDADDLNDAAGNCFLKTLEEPPPVSLLILIGTAAERQLSTIVSRCQVIRFAPPPIPVCVELLTALGVETGRAGLLARLAGGSVGQAMALNDPELWSFRETLIRGMAGVRPDPVGLAQEWTQFAKDGGRERATMALRLLIDWLRSCLELVAGTGTGGDDPTATAFVLRVGESRILSLLDRCVEADIQLDRNAQQALVLEAVTDSFVRGEPAERT
jgi:DNA polymerase-3 subunit delta'